MAELTAEYLRRRYHYEIVTGRFYSLRTGKNIKGHTSKGYLEVRVKGTRYRVHRLAFLWVTGEWPENLVDHINRVPSCNAWHNLRDVTNSENLWNTKGRASSGVKGVYKVKGYELWTGTVMKQYTKHYAGCYPTIDEAAAAVRMLREQLHGEFAAH